MALLTVITTVYNCEEYLEESIQSILDQTFNDFEFIILNDGSTDKSREIILSYRDKRIRFFDYTYNRKIPYRRNQVISESFTDYIVIHDGDDISFNYRLKEQYEFLENNKNVFCVGGHAIKISSESDVIGEMTYPPEKHSDIISMLNDEFYLNPMIDPTTMFRKNIFLNLGGYTSEENIYTVPDYDLWLRAMYNGYNFANLQKPIIKYRVNSNGMTIQKKREMIRAHMIVWHRWASAITGCAKKTRRFYGNKTARTK